MCWIAIALNQIPEWPLIILHTRDENLSRPTQRATFDAETGILCGRDLVSGGTWIGVSQKHIVALTNRHVGSDDTTNVGTLISRGQVALGLLTSTDYLMPKCSPCNIVTCTPGARTSGAPSDLRVNFCAYPDGEQHVLASGIHVIGNGGLGETTPRLQTVRKLFQETIRKPINPYFDGNANCFQGLFQELATQQSRVIYQDLERHYGTRSQTLILRNATGSVFYLERIIGPECKVGDWHCFVC